jgi:catalase
VRPRSFLTPWRLIVSEAGTWELAREAAALGFISNAFNHLKVIGYLPAAKPLLQRAGTTDELVDAGVVKLDGANAIAGFIAAAKKTRIWDRAPKVRNVP